MEYWSVINWFWDYLSYRYTAEKAKTVDAIEHYMKLGSSYPVLMDEIEPYFFQQDQYSRHLVVDTMNELVNNPHAIAPLIGTTNYDSGFTMLRETARRTYYLQIDKVIDDQQKVKPINISITSDKP